jgi:hypothetical protein
MLRQAAFGIIITAMTWVCSAVGAEITRDKFFGGISIKGEVVPGDDLVFKNVTNGMTNATVFLESPGGNALVAIAIGRLIRARGYYTHVTAGSCASACGLIWLGGRQRSIGSTGRVGFHAVYNAHTLQEVGTGNALVGAYLNELGLSDAAIYYITHKPPTDMQWLTASDANKVGIDAEVDHSDATAPEAGTYERKWVDACIEATRDEWAKKQLADNVIYGFCVCVARRIVKTATEVDLAKPSPRPKVVDAYNFCRRRGCQGADWLAFCPAVRSQSEP